VQIGVNTRGQCRVDNPALGVIGQIVSTASVIFATAATPRRSCAVSIVQPSIGYPADRLLNSITPSMLSGELMNNNLAHAVIASLKSLTA
jgi:hypothetical protein